MGIAFGDFRPILPLSESRIFFISFAKFGGIQGFIPEKKLNFVS